MVSCAKCGFLTYKDHSTKMLEEASLEARRNGHFPTDGPIIPSPRCFVLTFNLPLEVSELAKQASDQEEKGPAIFLKVIQKERSCPTFCQWHQGSSTKEHREMLLHIEMQKLHDDQRKADLVRQQEQREKDIARQEQRLRDAERQRKEDLEWQADQNRRTEEQWRSETKSQQIEMQKLHDDQRKADLVRQQEQREKDITRQEQRLRDAERQRKEDLEWQAEQNRKTEERWRSETKSQQYSLIVIGVIGASIIAAAQIVGSLIQAGWFKER
jgi:hypothetical protein